MKQDIYHNLGHRPRNTDKRRKQNKDNMTPQHFNNLTPEEAELLACLAEECAEVIQVIGKIQRHGFDSRSPYTSDDAPNAPTNRELLHMELGDIAAIALIQLKLGHLNEDQLNNAAVNKIKRGGKYLHHAKVPQDLIDDVDYYL